jgi:hypothetical protein
MYPTDGTETRGAWLFRHLLTLYGSRFLAMWRGVDTDDLKRAWSQRLQGVSPDALRAGLQALDGVPHPPTLPEFLALCREGRMQQYALTVPRLGSASGVACSPEVAEANLARMRAIVAGLAHVKPSPAWAFRLLDKAATKTANRPPPNAVRIALDAIGSPAGRAYFANATSEERTRWRAALAAIGSTAAGLMPSRVPGEDDEELAGEVA